MRLQRFFATCVLLFLCTGLLWAVEPDLKKGIFIKDGSVNLNLTYDANPCAVDWNNDGAQDLVIGEFTYGHINLFLNQGTNINPVFNGASKIKSNGSPITVTYG